VVTAAGRAAWDRYIYEGMARERQLLHALSLDELSRLNALLRKVMLSIDG
jgi:tagatose-1,6-bisphosphate aldolase